MAAASYAEGCFTIFIWTVSEQIQVLKGSAFPLMPSSVHILLTVPWAGIWGPPVQQGHRSSQSPPVSGPERGGHHLGPSTWKKKGFPVFPGKPSTEGPPDCRGAASLPEPLSAQQSSQATKRTTLTAATPPPGSPAALLAIAQRRRVLWQGAGACLGGGGSLAGVVQTAPCSPEQLWGPRGPLVPA